MILCSFCRKTQQEVEQLIAGPESEEGKSYICNECVDVSHQIIIKQKQKKTIDIKSDITPEKINEHLNQYVVGQHVAKEILSVAIYNHYKRIHNTSSLRVEKSNILMLGPSGVGKTHLVKNVASYLDIPFAITDATSLTESGYVGDDVETILERLIQNADDDIERAKHGIIYIDEIDKKVAKIVGGSANRDVSGEGVQQSLLKLIEGSVVKIPSRNYKLNGETIDFDTSNILFIAGGAFVDIEKIIQKDLGLSGGIGFGSDPTSSADEALQYLKPSHLIDYGLIPEFVGRFPVTVPMHSLNEEDLIKILVEPKDNLISQYKWLFEIDNVILEFSDVFLKQAAKECIEQRIGARGLRSVLEKTLLQTQYVLPKLRTEGINKIIVNGIENIIYLHNKKEVKLQK